MQRKTTEWILVLTYKGPYRIQLNSIPEKDAKEIIKIDLNKFLAWLRDKGKHNKWSYTAKLYLSNKDINGNPKALHNHLYLEGCPGSTIVNEIKRYWYKRYGQVHVRPFKEHLNDNTPIIVDILKKYNMSSEKVINDTPGSFQNYVEKQSIYTCQQQI